MITGKVKSTLACLLACGMLACVWAWATAAPHDPGDPAQPLTAKNAPQEKKEPTRQAADVTSKSYGGVVINHTTGKPVPGVKVAVRQLLEGKTVDETKLVSDAEGRFHFDLPSEKEVPADTEVAVTAEAPAGYVAFTEGATAYHRNRVGQLRVEKALARISHQPFAHAPIVSVDLTIG
jgi:hypothetical protein